MKHLSLNDSAFHASTGASGYDSIEFSAEPLARLVSRVDGPVAVVHHIGVIGDGIASAMSHDPASDVFMVNLSSTGLFRARCDGVAAERRIRRGNVSFIPGCQTTMLEFPATQSLLAMTVKATHLEALNRELGIVRPEPIFCERHDQLSQLIGMIEAELRQPGFAADLMVDSLMRTVAIIMGRQSGTALDRAPIRIHLSPTRLARVIDFVENHLDAEIGLDDMANVAGLTPFHFSRVFKLATGETPYHFLGSRRLNRARRLLTEGKMPLAELALACGFSSQSHFTAAFSKAMGVSPGRYRKASLE